MSKQKILNIADDLMSSFLYYNRKEDDELPPGAIEKAILSGEITVEEIMQKLRTILEESVEEQKKGVRIT